MINIDIGKIENLYYRPTILMRYSKVLYKTMLREIKNDEKKFSRWKKKRVKLTIVGGLPKHHHGKQSAGPKKCQ